MKSEMPESFVNTLPALGLGCASLGNLYRALSDREAFETVDAAWTEGLRLFDTAPYYGLGRSERRLGDALRERAYGEYILSTKVGRILEPNACDLVKLEQYGFVDPLPFNIRYDYSYAGIMRSFEASLNRLGLPRIDILLVHDIGRATHGDDNSSHFRALADGGYRALDELRCNGDIQAIGLGVNEWQVCSDAMKVGRWDCFLLAGRYTLLEQEPLHGFFDECQAHGAGIILGGVYNSGILAMGTRGEQPYYNYTPAPQNIIERVSRIETVCEFHGVTLAAAALQFPLAHPAVRCVIPGLSAPSQIAETKRLAAEKIPTAFWDQLIAEQLLDDAAPVPCPEEASNAA